MIIDGKYRIISQLGAGGMCTVYRAHHEQLERDVAIKVLQDKFLVNPNSIQRFQREALAVSKLDHPNIVQCFGCGIWTGKPYIAMELLDGQSLAQLIQSEGALAEERAMPLFKQICAGLEHAHSHGILHRDLKPSNVMVTADGVARIVDFGIAKILPESGIELQKLTQTGSLVGSLAYMSAEQLAGEKVDARSDIYSFGCLMYQTIEGVVPVNVDNPVELVAHHESASAPRPTKCGDGLANIIQRMLSHSANERFESCSEVFAALNRGTAPPVVPVKRQPKKRRAPIGFVAAGAIVLALAFFVFHQKLSVEQARSYYSLEEIRQQDIARNWPRVQEMCEADLVVLKDRAPTRDLLLIKNSLAQAYFNMDMWGLALEASKSLIIDAKTFAEPRFDCAGNLTAARCSVRQQRWVQANVYIHAAIDDLKLLDNSHTPVSARLRANAYHTLAKVEVQMGRQRPDPELIKTGINDYRFALNLCVKEKIPDVEKTIREELKTLDEKRQEATEI